MTQLIQFLAPIKYCLEKVGLNIVFPKYPLLKKNIGEKTWSLVFRIQHLFLWFLWLFQINIHLWFMKGSLMKASLILMFKEEKAFLIDL